MILQLADPDLIRWFVGQLRDYAKRRRPRPGEIKVMAAAPAHVGDIDMCRERVRWFPALVSNHVVDLVNKYDPAELPPGLTGYVRDREGYDYLHHAEVGSTNAEFVTDEVVDRFCVIGPVEEHLAKLAELADAGVDQFNIYLMNGDEEEHARDLRPRDHPGHEGHGRRQGLIERMLRLTLVILAILIVDHALLRTAYDLCRLHRPCLDAPGLPAADRL